MGHSGETASVGALPRFVPRFVIAISSIIWWYVPFTLNIIQNPRVRWIKKCDLLIIDELGYLPVSKIEANFFFSLISELYERTSIVITSNKGFEGWAEVLGDAILVTALLDRLTHRCQVLQFTDQSYRFAHRKEIFDMDSTEVLQP
jgi:DNA replication protein